MSNNFREFLKYNECMQQTLNPQLNQLLVFLQERIIKLIPDVVITEQPGFRATNYGKKPGMNHVACYIICYDQKANLGFPQGIVLQPQFKQLKGTGKTPRHLSINQSLLNQLELLDQIIRAACKLN